MDKVFAQRNLLSAFTKVHANHGSAGVDHVTVEAFAQHLDKNLTKLSEQLRSKTYQPQKIRRVYIPKADGTRRPLGIPTVRDRVVQAAVRHVIEPIFEREFHEHSYGFRPGKGCKDALRRVDDLLRQGYVYVVDADLKSYFDTIPHDPLMARVQERIADGSVLKLIESFLKAGVLEGLTQWTPTEAGAPQGAVLSPLLSNIYLNPLDHLMARRGFEMVRYADDFVVLCRTPEEAQQALDAIQQWTRQAGLTLHPEKTRIVDARIEGFDFLGYHFRHDRHWPRQKSVKKLKDAIRAKTKRTSGHSLATIIADVNRTLRGWFAYFKHARRWKYSSLDSYVRGRLRSILRRRLGRKGRARGSDHQLWPNALFTTLGLYTMTTAHALQRQPCRR